MLVFANLVLWTNLISVYYRDTRDIDRVSCISSDTTETFNVAYSNGGGGGGSSSGGGGRGVFEFMGNDGSSRQSEDRFKSKEPPHAPEHEGEDAGTIGFWVKMALIFLLVMVGGVFAGLTIGLMGLDETNLHVLMASGSPTERVHAETVFKLLSRGKHWVLVTLLLGNVIVNETLPVVLDSELGGGVVAILISTLLIVVFGEIIPQAVCARYGLAIGAFCAKPMLMFMYIMSPVAYPIAMLLDSWLGVHHGTTYRRTELKTLVSLHQVDGIGELTDDEVTIIASVLDLKEKPVSMVMTPLEDVFTLSEDAVLDEELMEEIVSAGYSRIPIYRFDDASNFIGMLLVKRLITYDPEDHITVRQFTINSLPEVAPNTSCLDILNFFQEGRSHMAMVTSEPGGFGVPIGVITLEDVIEELLGEEIVDESDVYVDIHNKIRVIRKPARNVSMLKNLKNLLRSPAMSDAATPLLASQQQQQQQQQQQGAPLDGQPSFAVHVGDLHAGHTPSSYMATGKTIIQPRNSSLTGLFEPTLVYPDGTVEHDCAFKTGSLTKTDHLAQYHNRQAQEPQSVLSPEENVSSAMQTQAATTTDVSQTALINIPTVREIADIARTIGATTATTGHIEEQDSSASSGLATPTIEEVESHSSHTPQSHVSGAATVTTTPSSIASQDTNQTAGSPSTPGSKKKKKKKSRK
ncbi:hypothetical protein BG004_007163 [Podila humilis]|nr:hypothetical protein BG004_007163 [Podila humilis]